jgi:hypothetical protein
MVLLLARRPLRGQSWTSSQCTPPAAGLGVAIGTAVATPTKRTDPNAGSAPPERRQLPPRQAGPRLTHSHCLADPEPPHPYGRIEVHWQPGHRRGAGWPCRVFAAAGDSCRRRRASTEWRPISGPLSAWESGSNGAGIHRLLPRRRSRRSYPELGSPSGSGGATPATPGKTTVRPSALRTGSDVGRQRRTRGITPPVPGRLPALVCGCVAAGDPGLLSWQHVGGYLSPVALPLRLKAKDAALVPDCVEPARAAMEQVGQVGRAESGGPPQPRAAAGPAC